MGIARNILDQLGGEGRLRAMTGARNFVALENGVAFKIGNGPKRVNYVSITLNDSDTYSVKMSRGTKVLQEFDEVYCEQLMDIFEEGTGLYLTFSPRK